MDATDSKKFVLEFFRELGAGQVDTAWGKLAEDVVWELMAKSSDYPFAHRYTKASYRALIEQSGGLFPQGLTMTMKKAIAEEDCVAIEAESHGAAFNGKIYNNFYHFRVDLEGGRIQAVREYLDSGHAMEVLGRRT